MGPVNFKSIDSLHIKKKKKCYMCVYCYHVTITFCYKISDSRKKKEKKRKEEEEEVKLVIF